MIQKVQHLNLLIIFLPPSSHEPENQAFRSSKENEQLRNLMDIVPRLQSRVESLEKELSETKQTLGTAILQLIEKVKKLENKLRKKRKSKEAKDAEGQDQEVRQKGFNKGEKDRMPMTEEDLQAVFQASKTSKELQELLEQEEEAATKYPLTKEVLSQMLKLKLETEEESSMALELIKFVKQQLEEFEDSRE
ncbi:hypothetical protein Tco_0005777 [Tanacetum coccineum]